MAGPVELTLDTQKFLLCPTDEKTELTSVQTSAAVSALRKARTNVTATAVLLGKVQTLLGAKEYGAVASPKLNAGAGKAQLLFDLLLAAFRLKVSTDKHGLEDMRRCVAHVQQMLKVVGSGLAEDGLVLADLEAPVYQKHGKTGIGGYVDPPWYQKVSLRMASNYRKFWEEGPLTGPIHLNLDLLVGKEAKFACTLVHEATHKFGRTNDIAYYNDSQAPGLAGVLTGIRATAGPETLVEKMITMAGSDLTGTHTDDMSPVEALNNADSHAYFVHWMAANATMLD